MHSFCERFLNYFSVFASNSPFIVLQRRSVQRNEERDATKLQSDDDTNWNGVFEELFLSLHNMRGKTTSWTFRDDCIKQEQLRKAPREGRIDDVRKYLNDDTVGVNGKCGWGSIVMFQSSYWIMEPISMQLFRITIGPLSWRHVGRVILPSRSFCWIVVAISMLLVNAVVIRHTSHSVLWMSLKVI